MSRVSVTFKIYPAEGVEIEALSVEIKKLNPVAVQPVDVAFGIKVLKARFVFDDTQNSSSKLEDQIRKSAMVGETEVEDESLM